MYHEHFGITESPFSITPDPRFLYMSKGHHEALAHLLYGVSESGGFVLLTGEVGTGKTSVCRCLLEQLPEGADVALILNPRVNEMELLAGICDELGVAYPRDTTSLKVMVDILNNHLLDIHARGRHAVVIIDEAQNLSPDVLEQVRLLTNLETATRKLLQIILVGQPELSDLLDRREMRQVVQRITARYHLDPLDRSETEGYVRYRLAVGGLPRDLFSDRAIATIYKKSRGIPRLINSLSDRCLLAAYVRDQKKVTWNLVREAAKEVFGQRRPERRRRVRTLGWSAAAATAILLIAVSLPVILGPAAMPFGWPSDIQELFLAESDGSSEPESEPALMAAEPTVQVMNSTPPEPELSPGQAVMEPEVVVAAAVPDSESEQAPAEIPETVATHKPQAAEAVEGVDQVLVPAAGPPAEVTEAQTEPKTEPKTEPESPIAKQIALAPAVGETTKTNSDPEVTPQGPAETRIGGASQGRFCHDRTRLGATSTSELGALFDDPTAQVDKRRGTVMLFACWGLDPEQLDAAEPCANGTNGGLECLEGKGNWRLLSQINRPALIPLVDERGVRTYAVVSSLDGQRVTLLVGGRRLDTDVDTLAAYWSGGYLVLWRPPSMYYRLLGRGARGKDVAWLKGKFAEILGSKPFDDEVATFDSTLHEQVVAFQKTRGLKPDGIVGARTLIHINTVTSAPAVPILYDSGH